MIRRILVALDGSEPSQRALDYAVELSEKFGAELTMLSVVPRLALYFIPHEGFGALPRVPGYQERMRILYKKVLAEAEEKVGREHPEVRVVTRMREGRPSAAIVDLAEDEGFDLIVIGSRGLGGITGWILGSTSRRVADSCTRPVLIVK